MISSPLIYLSTCNSKNDRLNKPACWKPSSSVTLLRGMYLSCREAHLGPGICGFFVKYRNYWIFISLQTFSVSGIHDEFNICLILSNPQISICNIHKLVKQRRNPTKSRMQVQVRVPGCIAHCSSNYSFHCLVKNDGDNGRARVVPVKTGKSNSNLCTQGTVSTLKYPLRDVFHMPPIIRDFPRFPTVSSTTLEPRHPLVIP